MQVQSDSFQSLPRIWVARILSEAGIVTTVRKTRGDDIDAACGQLAGEVQDRTRVAQRMAKRRTIPIAVMGAGSDNKEA